MVEGEDILDSIERREDLLAEIRAQQQVEPEAPEAPREPCRVIEVNWVLREADRKLIHRGFRVVTGKPQQNLMVEVIDGEKGIQSKPFMRQCRHIARLMGVDEGELQFAQDLEEHVQGS